MSDLHIQMKDASGQNNLFPKTKASLVENLPTIEVSNDEELGAPTLTKTDTNAYSLQATLLYDIIRNVYAMRNGVDYPQLSGAIPFENCNPSIYVYGLQEDDKYTYGMDSSNTTTQLITESVGGSSYNDGVLELSVSNSHYAIFKILDKNDKVLFDFGELVI